MRHHHRSAFTLIELLIALSLSLLVVYTAFAAFRVVAQAVSVSQRMATENNLLRTGFFAALHELDYWDLYDNRHSPNPDANPLRVPGKPFARLTYDPTKRPHQRETWYRGWGFGEDTGMTMRWGNYSLVTRSNHGDAFRAWYPTQLMTINQTLGAYGMISYLPGNAIFQWYTGSGSSFTTTGIPRDIWERTANTPVTVNSATYDQGNFIELLPQRPIHWPNLRIEARRYAVWSSFIDLCQVEMLSPFSGETTRLSFWGVGTTLRGARQQRNLDTVVER